MVMIQAPAASPGSGSLAPRAVLHRIGLIADVQYADIPNAWNFTKSKQRFYRNAMAVLDRAMSWWDTTGSIDFAVNLGDIIDGQNRAVEGQGEAALITVLKRMYASEEPPHVRLHDFYWSDFMLLLAGHAKVPLWLHLIGNHELYNFTREQLTAGITVQGLPFSCNNPFSPSADRLYYSFLINPQSKWRVVVLDPYDVSCIRNGGGRHGIELTIRNGGMDAEATALCQSKNANPIDSDSCDFFKGLTGEDSRWVPFNGGVGAEQLAWLADVLRAAQRRGEHVIVFSHIILNPDICSWLPFDPEDAAAAAAAPAPAAAAPNPAASTAPHPHGAPSSSAAAPSSAAADPPAAPPSPWLSPSGGAGHQPAARTVLWNFREVLEVFRSVPGVVRAAVTGHAHKEGRCLDPASGTHHVTLPSPIEIEAEGDDACALLELYAGGAAALRYRWGPRPGRERWLLLAEAVGAAGGGGGGGGEAAPDAA